jgi:predicted dehydrogenase
MANVHNIGIIGCGDYVTRWESSVIKKCKRIKVKSLRDLDEKRADTLASMVGGQVVDSAETIIADGDIDIVCVFVPPFVRKDLLLKAADAGKHIITTKPLASQTADAMAILKSVENANVRCGVFYRRAGDAAFETYREIFESGEIGKLALYKHDWIHHYPQWTDWALDPAKNGGPFMDAMMHNMNIARYLMARPATHCTYFSDSHAHDLPCADTEFMKLDFQDGGSAHLFVTWAADLEVFSTEGNDREHIDIHYMVTDQGWRLTESETDGKCVITASKEGKKKQWPVEPLPQTPYDEFAETVETGKPLASDIPTIRQAVEDIKIIRDAEQNPGRRFTLDLAID